MPSLIGFLAGRIGHFDVYFVVWLKIKLYKMKWEDCKLFPKSFYENIKTFMNRVGDAHCLLNSYC